MLCTTSTLQRRKHIHRSVWPQPQPRPTLQGPFRSCPMEVNLPCTPQIRREACMNHTESCVFMPLQRPVCLVHPW